jgi:hypothetical protein
MASQRTLNGQNNHEKVKNKIGGLTLPNFVVIVKLQQSKQWNTATKLDFLATRTEQRA